MTLTELIAHLAKLKADGHVRQDGTEIVGVAADGTEVSLGDIRDMKAFHAYIRAHPTPDTW